MHLILQCKYYATSNHSSQNKRKFTFTDIGQAAFGTIGKLIVDFGVLFWNLGVSTSFIIFISSNLQVKTSKLLQQLITSVLNVKIDHKLKCFEPIQMCFICM